MNLPLPCNGVALKEMLLLDEWLDSSHIELYYGILELGINHFKMFVPKLEVNEIFNLYTLPFTLFSMIQFCGCYVVLFKDDTNPSNTTAFLSA